MSDRRRRASRVATCPAGRSRRRAEQPIDRAHPLGVAPGQIVVERQDVRAAPEKALSAAGITAVSVLPSPVCISHIAIVERQRRDELFVEWALSEHRPRLRAPARRGGRRTSRASPERERD